MSVILQRQSQLSLPAGSTGANPYWVSRGLKALYLLTSDLWSVDWVNNVKRVSHTGGGNNYRVPSGLYTSAELDEAWFLPHNCGASMLAPMTVVSRAGGPLLLAGATLACLKETAAYTGWYGNGCTYLATSNNSSFDGNVTAGYGTIAASWQDLGLGEVRLEAAGNNGVISLDTSAVVPGVSTVSYVTYGSNYRGFGQADAASPGILEFLATFNAPLSRAELLSLANEPGQLFRRMPKRIWTWRGAVEGTPTLSAALLINLATTTATPRVTLTF